MQSTLSRRTALKEESAFSQVELPQFSRSCKAQSNSGLRSLEVAYVGQSAETLHSGHSQRITYTGLTPVQAPSTIRRRIPALVRINRALRTVLVALCGIAILGYGLDVVSLNEVGRLQEQARRINEQNSELSAQLLRAISFEGIQDSVLGRFGLHVPEQVIVVREKPAPSLKAFKENKHSLPIMSGY